MNMEKDHQDSSATVERSDSADKQGSLDCNSVSSISNLTAVGWTEYLFS